MEQIKQQIDAQLPLWLEAVETTGDQYPCDFDLLWKWAGYSRKDPAKRKLLTQLNAGSDYRQTAVPPNGGVVSGGKAKEIIKLTLNAAKQFLLQAPTQNGKAVREYFIECENKWRKLVLNIGNGRLRLEDKLTGQVIDNPLNDPEFVDTRLESARAHNQLCQGMRSRHPNLPGAEYPKLNAKISEAVLGQTPRKFLVSHGLITKRKNRKGNMVYPAHPNGREVMAKPQIAATYALQQVCGDVFKRAVNTESARQECNRRLDLAKDLFSPIHGSYLTEPLLLQDIQSALVPV